jgi:hypothetical protein
VYVQGGLERVKVAIKGASLAPQPLGQRTASSSAHIVAHGQRLLVQMRRLFLIEKRFDLFFCFVLNNNNNKMMNNTAYKNN